MEKPMLRVSRPVSACSRCRNAKIKCDGKLPACSACEKANRTTECSNVNDQFAKGKERSYVAALESRVERLQDDLACRRSYKAVSGLLEPVSDESCFGQSNASPERELARGSKDDPEVEDLVSDFGLLSVNATARDFHGFTSQMSFARLVLSTSSVEPMPTTFPCGLPPKTIAIASLNEFLNTFSTVYSTLPETALFGSFGAVYQNDGSYARAFDWWAVHLVLAISLATKSRSRQSDLYNQAVRHVNNALEYAESVLRPGSILGIQAVILLAIYSLVDPSHFSNWFLVGTASRMMVDLGIYQEVVVSNFMLATPDTRQYICQCVYSLDRACSIATLRALSFSDDSVHTKVDGNSFDTKIARSMPLSDKNGSLRPNVSFLVYRLRVMQSNWYHPILQSNARDRAAPWQTRKRYIEEAENWIAAQSAGLPRAVYYLLQSETLYGISLLMQPSRNSFELDPEGRELVIANASKYARSTKDLCDEENVNLSTCLDRDRSIFVGTQLLRLWKDHSGKLAHDQKERVIAALSGINHVQDYLAIRFGSSKTYRCYKLQLTETLQSAPSAFTIR